MADPTAVEDPSRRLLQAWGIGLTGGIATGKSTVAGLLRAQGYHVIDADHLARDVVAPGTPGLAAIAKRFGPAVLATGGALDRQKLGALVFSAPAARADLEAITHPLIRAALHAQLVRLGLAAAPQWFFYEAALIFEIRSEAHYRSIWATYCPPDLQRQRLMARSGCSEERARAIIAAQMPADAKAQRADVVIDTSVPLAAVEAQLHAQLLLLAAV